MGTVQTCLFAFSLFCGLSGAATDNVTVGEPDIPRRILVELRSSNNSDGQQRLGRSGKDLHSFHRGNFADEVDVNGAIVFGANSAQDLGIGDVIATSIVHNIQGDVVAPIHRKHRPVFGLGQVGNLRKKQMHFIDSRIHGKDAMSVAAKPAKKNGRVFGARNPLAWFGKAVAAGAVVS